MLELIEQHRAALIALCVNYGVRQLDLFGSGADGSFDPVTSDLDFVVTFDDNFNINAFDIFFGLQEDLEKLFNRKVDLVTDRSIHNPYFRRSVDASRVQLYAA